MYTLPLNLFRVVKYSRSKIILVALSLIAVWNISAWVIAKNFFIAREEMVVGQEARLSQERSGDLADGIKRNLNFIDGIPDVVAQTTQVKIAVSKFGKNPAPSSQPLEIRKQRWTNDPVLNDLSKYLRGVQGNLQVDLIYVVNAAGDCIAAGNLNTRGSSIGTNFAERDFFLANKEGKKGMQYAVGKTTHIPGLFFASPILINGQFMGAVVAKIEVPNLTSLIHKVSAFVTDTNGVIILAQDKKREMLSLPGTPIAALSEKEKFDRYRRTDFPPLKMESWGDKNFASLMRVQDSSEPHILTLAEIPEYHLRVYADSEIAEIRVLERDESWFIFLLGLSGSVLILIVSGTILYADSVKTTALALDRAWIAERKIITVSEETQQRIGRELHDDLGQHLTGIAFRTEVLFQSLKRRDNSDSEEASKITALVNEAINKTRRLALGLYPLEIKNAGLHAMLKQLATNIQSIYEIECEFTGEAENRINDPLVLISLFRISQEAANNAVKHSGASKISITMATSPSGMTLEIADNGCGIGNMTGLETNNGLGMHTMHYRASLLGASFHIAEQATGGTRVTISLPIQ